MALALEFDDQLQIANAHSHIFAFYLAWRLPARPPKSLVVTIGNTYIQD
jgi:hypothetical protein